MKKTSTLFFGLGCLLALGGSFVAASEDDSEVRTPGVSPTGISHQANRTTAGSREEQREETQVADRYGEKPEWKEQQAGINATCQQAAEKSCDERQVSSK